MDQYQAQWSEMIAAAIDAEAGERGIDPAARADLAFETPPSADLGDLAVPMFPFAKLLRTSPAAIASAVAARLASTAGASDGTAVAAGPYVNIRLPRADVAASAVPRVLAEGDVYGRNALYDGTRITIEFSSPNTNKPLHLGHLRNDALGESLSRVLAACGATVRSVNLVNDRGIHICKSMLAYQEFGAGETPESSGVKGDRLVGDYYVKFNEWAKQTPDAEARARQLLVAWEAGDPDVVALWKKMNDWVLAGISQTYEATGIHFDAVYFESETYSSGKDEIARGIEAGVFYREDDGSVWVDLEPIGLDRKILLRADGTSVYLTQDIGTVIARYNDSPFDRMIYVVGSEQIYHFRVLFYVLELLGYEWAGNLFHLAYGMVNLPEGKMKSREGTVVDADDLIAELTELAAAEIRAKERESAVENVDETAHKIAIGALHYYLLQVGANKDMIFNPRESLSFTGNTGPYLQYMCARVNSMIRKAADRRIELDSHIDFNVLDMAEEWELVKLVARYPATVEAAGRDYAPGLLAGYLYDVAKAFSQYYHDVPIITAPSTSVRTARLALSRAVLQVLRNGLDLLNIPYLDAM
ncbi:MAG: arginine--tRNA ligase [Spirochaetaceae bacterium]|nr:MAG: arginine--tRNA ligase [Spirochaetaceae bacterium]